MKVGNRVRTRTLDSYDNLLGTIVGIQDDDEPAWVEYHVELDDPWGGEAFFNEHELAVIEDA